MTLKDYGVDVKRKGDQHHGYCPLPKHIGKRNSQSFSANLKKKIFNCFGCGAKGNVLDFAAYMEGVDPNDGMAIREVAIRLKAKFEKGHANTPSDQQKTEHGTLLRAINVPLDFELKDLDSDHPYLLKRGFQKGTIEHFGLGYCSRGLLKGRIAIPLHDAKGLIGYAGRIASDQKESPENPRYIFPGDRTRNNVILEFRKTLFLYNAFRISVPVTKLFIVEGFASVWWLTQNGVPDVVATMGADCSPKQAELTVSLVAPGGVIWIISDGDTAGERHATTIFKLVSPFRSVRLKSLPTGKQPTDLSRGELNFD